MPNPNENTMKDLKSITLTFHILNLTSITAISIESWEMYSPHLQPFAAQLVSSSMQFSFPLKGEGNRENSLPNGEVIDAIALLVQEHIHYWENRDRETEERDIGGKIQFTYISNQWKEIMKGDQFMCVHSSINSRRSKSLQWMNQSLYLSFLILLFSLQEEHESIEMLSEMSLLPPPSCELFVPVQFNHLWQLYLQLSKVLRIWINKPQH